MEINELYQHFKKHPSVQTDSRKIKKGDLFFALKGPILTVINMRSKL
jgi:UDP-N-acetylmuramoyl-tripeptide--D-alanyl-D-alanine ligase